MSEEKTYQVDLSGLYDAEYKRMLENLNNSNRSWAGLIRLVITLATSLLVFSITFANDVFFRKESFILENDFLLIASWLLLLGAFILGIIAEIDMAIFWRNLASEADANITSARESILKGETKENVTFRQSETNIKGMNLLWGIFEIGTFFMGLFSFLFYSFAQIKSVPSGWQALGVLLVGAIVLLVGNISNKTFSFKK